MSRFVIRAVNTGVKFDLRAANGQTILTSEVYRTEAACRAGIEGVRKNVPAARLEDLTGAGSKVPANPKFQVYLDKAGQFRFRLKARNGCIIAVSDGYGGKAACLGGIESVRQNVLQAQIVRAVQP